ncbi:MAG TPA: DUF5372 family protein [Candidatus Binatia bacterium]|nr:DUF5372 family protein [Candidatus Binatia bacterium]
MEFVTIIHPYHPLPGQRCEVVRIRRGANPAVILRLPDGSHAAVALSWTDYETSTPPQQSSGEVLLLDLSGLRQVVQLLEHLCQDGRFPKRSQPRRRSSSSPAR